MQGTGSLPDCPRVGLKTSEVASSQLVDRDEPRNSKDGSGGGGWKDDGQGFGE